MGNLRYGLILWASTLALGQQPSLHEPAASRPLHPEGAQSRLDEAEDWLRRRQPDWLLLDDKTRVENEKAAGDFLKALTQNVYATEGGDSTVFRVVEDAAGAKSLAREDYKVRATVHLPDEHYYAPYVSGSLAWDQGPKSRSFEDGAAISYQEEVEATPTPLTIVAADKSSLLVEVFPRNETRLPKREFKLLRLIPSRGGGPARLAVTPLTLDPESARVSRGKSEILERSAVARARLERHGKYPARTPEPTRPIPFKEESAKMPLALGQAAVARLSSSDDGHRQALADLPPALDRSVYHRLTSHGRLPDLLGWAKGKAQALAATHDANATRLIRKRREVAEEQFRRLRVVKEEEETRRADEESAARLRRLPKEWDERLDTWISSYVTPVRQTLAHPLLGSIVRDEASFDRFRKAHPSADLSEFSYDDLARLRRYADQPRWKFPELLIAIRDNEKGMRLLERIAATVMEEPNRTLESTTKELQEKSADERKSIEKKLAAEVPPLDERIARNGKAVEHSRAMVRKYEEELNGIDKGIGYYFTRQSTLDRNRKIAEGKRKVARAGLENLEREAARLADEKEALLKSHEFQLRSWDLEKAEELQRALEAVRKRFGSELSLSVFVGGNIDSRRSAETAASTQEKLFNEAAELKRLEAKWGPMSLHSHVAQENAASAKEITVRKEALDRGIASLKSAREGARFAQKRLEGWAHSLRGALELEKLGAAAKLPPVSYQGREVQPVLVGIGPRKAALLRALVPVSRRNAKLYWLDLHDPGSLHRQERLLVAASPGGGAGPALEVISLKPGSDPLAVTKLALARPLDHDGRPAPPIPIAELAEQTAPYFRTVRQTRPLSSFPEFAAIRRSLERQKLMPEKFDLAQVQVAYVPGANSDFERAHETIAYVLPSPGQYLSSFYLPHEASRRLVRTRLNDYTIFSRVPLTSLERDGSQIPVHEVVHLIRRFGLKSPPPAKDDIEPTKEEFEAALPEIIRQERESPRYQARWQGYRQRNLYRIRGAKAGPVAAEKILKEEFEAHFYGKDFQRAKYLWRDQFRYYLKGEESAGWRAALSYMKHEQALDFDRALVAILRTSGGTSTSEFPAWVKAKLRQWWDEAP